jgi:nicotinic acid phosphoribosyltransferase
MRINIFHPNSLLKLIIQLYYNQSESQISFYMGDHYTNGYNNSTSCRNIASSLIKVLGRFAQKINRWEFVGNIAIVTEEKNQRSCKKNGRKETKSAKRVKGSCLYRF